MKQRCFLDAVQSVIERAELYLSSASNLCITKQLIYFGHTDLVTFRLRRPVSSIFKYFLDSGARALQGIHRNAKKELCKALK